MKHAASAQLDLHSTEPPLSETASNLVRRLIVTLTTWRQRSKTRAQLAGMSAHTMRDIGITTSEIEIESNKPFWEA